MNRYRIGPVHIVCDSASDAIRTDTAKAAPTGAQLLDAADNVLATKERLELPSGWIVCWIATAAWPDLEPPTDLARRLSEVTS